jgi:hypothetical protein
METTSGTARSPYQHTAANVWSDNADEVAGVVDPRLTSPSAHSSQPDPPADPENGAP